MMLSLFTFGSVSEEKNVMKKRDLSVVLVVLLASMVMYSPVIAQTTAKGSPGEMVKNLENRLQSARSNQVNVLAPGLFEDAQSAFMKAGQGLEKGAKLSSIQENISDGNASLDKAEEIAQVSRTILPETIKARDKALAVNADRLDKPYMEVENQFLRLTRAIEKDNLSYAQKNAPGVAADFRKLEIMAIKDAALGEARKMMADAKENDFEDIVPAAYEDAQKVLEAADAYIEQNPYAASTIAQKADHAEFMARRMMAIQESSGKFKSMDPEQTALYFERILTNLSEKLSAGDLRNIAFDDQIANLAGSIREMESRQVYLSKMNQDLTTQSAQLQSQINELKGYSREQQAAKEALAAERAFDEQYNAVQEVFRSDEAEVYKQGNQLVIRLRGIQFPAGEATLRPDNYILLSKVQKAIKTFGQPFVTIEGHTDTTESTGQALTSQELSLRRADVVKTYLVANDTLPAGRIRATGYGSERPLAPNTTAEGRAINRRIDLLITPTAGK